MYAIIDWLSFELAMDGNDFVMIFETREEAEDHANDMGGPTTIVQIPAGVTQHATA